jgi:hypothetical protein
MVRMSRSRKPIRSAPALRLGQGRDGEQGDLELLVDSAPQEMLKESFIARETAALQEIRSRLPRGRSVRDCFSETDMAEILRKHGFASEEDYELQHYLAFPPERRQ